MTLNIIRSVDPPGVSVRFALNYIKKNRRENKKEKNTGACIARYSYAQSETKYITSLNRYPIYA